MKNKILSTIRNFIGDNYGVQEMEKPCYNLEKLARKVDETVNNELNKVYIVFDDCIWYDENESKIVSVSTDKNSAIDSFKKYIEKVKRELNFENIEKEEEELNRKYIVDYDKEFFSVSVDGEYNSFHTEVSIIEKNLNKEKENSDSYEL